MLEQIRQFPGRQCLAANSNLLEKEIHDRGLMRGEDFLGLSVVFLGPSLRKEQLPSAWHAWSPRHMYPGQIQFILTAQRILVIGTVKKISDLHCQCVSLGSQALEFHQILHDEFDGQP